MKNVCHTVEELRALIDSRAIVHSPEKLDSQMRTLANYLHVNDTEDEDLAQKVRVPGSCDWLLEEPTFEAWRDRDGSTDDKQQQVYWLSGDPGGTLSAVAPPDHADPCENRTQVVESRISRLELSVISKSVAVTPATSFSSMETYPSKVLVPY
jgi:hypothetical protein